MKPRIYYAPALKRWMLSFEARTGMQHARFIQWKVAVHVLGIAYRQGLVKGK